MTASLEMLVEERLLIGGQLRNAAGDRTYENVNPATEEVVGRAADASADDMRAAIGAARTAFDDGVWAADPALRARCLRQLHEALLRHAPEIRATIRAEVGATEARSQHRSVRPGAGQPAVRRRPRREFRIR